MAVKSPSSSSADLERVSSGLVIKAEDLLRPAAKKEPPPTFAMALGIESINPIKIQVKPVERKADRQRDKRSVCVSKIPLGAGWDTVCRFISSVCEMVVDLSGQLLIGESIEIEPLIAGNPSTGEMFFYNKITAECCMTVPDALWMVRLEAGCYKDIYGSPRKSRLLREEESLETWQQCPENVTRSYPQQNKAHVWSPQQDWPQPQHPVFSPAKPSGLASAAGVASVSAVLASASACLASAVVSTLE